MTKKTVKKDQKTVEGSTFEENTSMSYHDNQEPEAPEVSQIMGGESAQSLSDRIMHGQSPSLSTKIRVNRILDRLRGKGYPEDEIKKVKIPLDNAEKYL